MEAVAAVGLASNVLQFIQFSCELFALSSHIRNSARGCPESHVDLGIIAKDLKKHNGALENAVTTSAELKILLERSSDVAKQLLSAIEEIRSSSKKNRRWTSFKQALRTVWKNNQIDELQSRLSKLREQIQYQLVIELRVSQEGVIKHIEKQNQKTEELKIELAEQRTATTTMLTAMQSRFDQLESVLSHTLMQQSSWKLSMQVEVRREIHRKCSNVIGSLQFVGMDSRRLQIPHASKQTCDWIFKSPPDSEIDSQPLRDFCTWLREGNGLFWISGYSGSGKSELMKFIESNENTHTLLQQWSRPFRLVMASFYFSPNGDPMQRSCKGFLQSLFHRILEAAPDLIELIFPERLIAAQDPNQLPWSLLELKDALMALGAYKNLSTRFYIHIDGLNEYDGNFNELNELLQYFASQPAFKVCVSSRLWYQFLHVVKLYSDHTLPHLHTREDGRSAKVNLGEHFEELIRMFDRAQNNVPLRGMSPRGEDIFTWYMIDLSVSQEGWPNNGYHNALRKKLSSRRTFMIEIYSMIAELKDPASGAHISDTMPLENFLRKRL